MKVFMDMAVDYPSVKAIAIGAVGTAREVVEYDQEMSERVAEIHVPLMDPEEIELIIDKGSNCLNLKFGVGLKKSISLYSNKLASVCHQLCLNLCMAQRIFQTEKVPREFTQQDMEEALKMYIDDASDTLTKTFEKAFRQERTKKYDNSRLILKALCDLPQEGAVRAAIYNKIQKMEPNYPQGNLTTFLEKLCSSNADQIIRYDSNSGLYSFKDPLHRAFAVALFSTKGPKLSGDRSEGDVRRMEELFEGLSELIESQIKNEFFEKSSMNITLSRPNKKR